MRTIKNLVSQNDKRVYVYLANNELGNKFMHQAEEEGFVFEDGAKPTSRTYAEIMAVNGNITINFVGTNGRIAFGSGVKKMGDKTLVRVDYEKYINGDADYFYHK